MKDEYILKIEEELYSPTPDVREIRLIKVMTGLYKYKDFIIKKVDTTKYIYRVRGYDWKIYKNNIYMITVKTLLGARIYFKSIVKK
jgi:hypothetical protein